MNNIVLYNVAVRSKKKLNTSAPLYETMLFIYKEYIDEGMIMIKLMFVRDSFISSHSICLSYRLLLHTLH